MSIQWFPGHMNSTRYAIKERMKAGLDVVIELLDARLPGSSRNPLLAQLTQGKPTLKLLNKQDLADPARTAEWLAHYNALPDTRAIGLDASITAPAKALMSACRELAPLRGGMAKPLRVLICGIPNVGKSTLINTLMGKRAAKTGDEPGITKVEQKLVLENDFYLFDTPGMLWPKILVPQSGFNLAASGAIGRNAFVEEEVAVELLAYLRQHYAAQLQERYKLEIAPELSDEELLEQLGRKRGAVLSGGRVNLQKAAEILMYEFRQGTLGRITLETPAEFDRWVLLGEQEELRRQEAAAERKRLRRSG
ncbi:MAG: ribosome biogenesis GTPase YlqF [Roseateles asaccharophilus]|uniref:Ribosome biogenesis GTPase A n=1 Tax=Roseateles asaccharophilus TaxID=582607 RepID=A0A4V3CJF2_9BURK|nr:ribosome biogenesis GTPase YlqF [Roseateles asaccharophilus]MDN3544144.1 ribosome biogenesis GTPase YlqF [Roseateles asaccharophilus]TDP09262.1 ribosome biogenesis GTPase A [Roseateles asaccharophilus]